MKKILISLHLAFFSTFAFAEGPSDVHTDENAERLLRIAKSKVWQSACVQGHEGVFMRGTLYVKDTEFNQIFELFSDAECTKALYTDHALNNFKLVGPVTGLVDTYKLDMEITRYNRLYFDEALATSDNWHVGEIIEIKQALGQKVYNISFVSEEKIVSGQAVREESQRPTDLNGPTLTFLPVYATAAFENEEGIVGDEEGENVEESIASEEEVSEPVTAN